jgi:hypothetical protein
MAEELVELRRRLDEIAREHLDAVGFEASSPDPREAWTAFKRFATATLPGATTVTIGYEACQASDRDRVLWLTFMRSVEVESGLGWHVGYAFTREAPDSLIGIAEQKWWSPGNSTLDAWFEQVEADAVFRQCLALDAWAWEGFSD